MTTMPPLDLGALVPLALAFLTDESVSLGAVKGGIRGWAKQDPLESLAVTVIGGGLAFYMAERDHNAACKTPWDGILYIASCLTVGHDNVFPTTATGHALATAVQTLGPALAQMAFDPPAAEARIAADESADVNRAILSRLDDIVRLLAAKP